MNDQAHIASTLLFEKDAEIKRLRAFYNEAVTTIERLRRWHYLISIWPEEDAEFLRNMARSALRGEAVPETKAEAK